MVFGRKGLNGATSPTPSPTPSSTPSPAPAPAGTPRDTHAELRAKYDLAEREGDPYLRLAHAGQALFDFVYKVSPKRGDQGARIEDMLGLLGALGGFSCIVGTLHFMHGTGKTPADLEMFVVRGDDGQVYYFGDLPNSALLESNHSLLSITLGAAQDCGGAVSLDKVHEVMKRTASSVGNPPFGLARLPDEHRPVLTGQQFVEQFWKTFVEPLDWFGVTPTRRSTAIGLAIKQAIEASAKVIDPGLAADIVTEYAVPAAKFDPAAYGVAF